MDLQRVADNDWQLCMEIISSWILHKITGSNSKMVMNTYIVVYCLESIPHGIIQITGIILNYELKKEVVHAVRTYGTWGLITSTNLIDWRRDASVNDPNPEHHFIELFNMSNVPEFTRELFVIPNLNLSDYQL